jgi:hypothetical protein
MSAWIRALGPVGERDGLRSSGNAALSSTLLDLLSLGQGRDIAPELERDLESATG